MNFVEKKTIHDRLLGVTHMDADRELLKKHSPGHKLVERRTFNAVSDASTLLWTLLDYATEAEILSYRREVAAAKVKAEEEVATESDVIENVSGQDNAQEDIAAEHKEDENISAQVNAEEEANQIIDDAKDEATSIIEEAESDAEDIRSEAEADAEEIKAQAAESSDKKKSQKKTSTLK